MRFRTKDETDLIIDKASWVCIIDTGHFATYNCASGRHSLSKLYFHISHDRHGNDVRFTINSKILYPITSLVLL